MYYSLPAMGPETVGVRTRPVWDQKSGLVLVLQVWCCVAKHGLVTLVIVIMLDTATFKVLFFSFSILCLEHHYCGDQQWRSLT